ncbi:hypothetical protein EJ06DRAFT_530729 [Trichodelitschia bisporula]|uniref:3-hydroxyisobutyrate dehydrogenase n=1 Tax=Trichodelitschia bisporula TaxID=703511 RepID=A0A6G1HVQ1_9PEZI|nr:hypothetical protein EJ06DRAFT_530729 [Trichodelitschia bisporula]
MAFDNNHIGFIGLGLMGVPMLRNLIQKTDDHCQFYLYDVASEPVEKLCAELPARTHQCQNPRDVAEKSDIIFTMVPEGAHVRAVYLTPETGILAARPGAALLCDCSTIDTATSLAVREAVIQQSPSTRFFDTPVSGGVLGAERATLTFMMGCAEDDPSLPLLKDLLGKMGRHLIACGGPSLGLTAKLCNNYCSGLIAIAVSEAMNIGMKSGMDPHVLASVFHSSTAQSAICDDWCPVPGLCPEAPASKGYKGGFKVQLMRKDFALAVDTANRVGAELALGEKGLEVYTETMNDPRCKDLDSRVVFRYLGGDEDWEKKDRSAPRQ